MTAKKKRASDLLRDVAKKRQQSDVILIYELKESLHEKGFGIFLLLFSLPLSIPIPVPPGYTTVFSVPLLLLSLQMMFGLDSPWIPDWLARKSIKRSLLVAIVDKTSPLIVRIECMMKNRLTFITHSTLLEKGYSAVCVLCSSAIAIPLPLTNFVPALGIVLIAMGIIGRDGLFILLGSILGAIGCILTILIIAFGINAITTMLSMLA